MKKEGILITGKLYKKHSTDAGFDIFSEENIFIPAKSFAEVSTGLRVLVPEGHVGIVKARSGLSFRHHIEVGAGVIDEGYTGEIKVKLYNHGAEAFRITRGDRIAQLLTIPIYTGEYKQEEFTDKTDRGDSGFGSTGGSNAL